MNARTAQIPEIKNQSEQLNTSALSKAWLDSRRPVEQKITKLSLVSEAAMQQILDRVFLLDNFQEANFKRDLEDKDGRDPVERAVHAAVYGPDSDEDPLWDLRDTVIEIAAKLKPHEIAEVGNRYQQIIDALEKKINPDQRAKLAGQSF